MVSSILASKKMKGLACVCLWLILQGKVTHRLSRFLVIFDHAYYELLKFPEITMYSAMLSIS